MAGAITQFNQRGDKLVEEVASTNIDDDGGLPHVWAPGLGIYVPNVPYMVVGEPAPFRTSMGSSDGMYCDICGRLLSIVADSMQLPLSLLV